MHARAGCGLHVINMTTHAINMRAAGRAMLWLSQPGAPGRLCQPCTSTLETYTSAAPVQQLTSEAFSCTLTFCQSQKTLSSGISVKNCLQRENGIDSAFVA